MNKGNLTNNTKTRRKGSMLQDSLSKIKYLLVLAFLLVLPMQAMAGFAGTVPIIDQTDSGVDRLVAFFDTRARDSFIQVTNTSTEKISIHVQIFDINSQFQTECEECNFDDMLTANDTHVYDIENLMTNALPAMPSRAVCTGLGSGTYGFMIISRTDGPAFSLIGMFRIIDEAGYEYRANAAGEDLAGDEGNDNVVNFMEANGNNLSDLVGITYVSIDSGQVYASPGVFTVFGTITDEILIYDQAEHDTSCSPTTFACAVGFLDKGIDNSLPNSKGQLNRICGTSTLDTNTSGWLHMPFATFGCTDPLVGDPDTAECDVGPPRFVGFRGLTNGTTTGTMDSWWSLGQDNVFND
ncbi:MAG: hypothetical protein IH964_07310 [Candidatus Dadabacteria bacterium]|nr:hypothetical protein [Candidatus Dadabacteria bacterium]